MPGKEKKKIFLFFFFFSSQPFFSNKTRNQSIQDLTSSLQNYLCSINTILKTAFTWIPSSMQGVHKPLISKAKEQTKAQEQAKHYPT